MGSFSMCVSSNYIHPHVQREKKKKKNKGVKWRWAHGINSHVSWIINTHTLYTHTHTHHIRIQREREGEDKEEKKGRRRKERERRALRANFKLQEAIVGAWKEGKNSKPLYVMYVYVYIGEVRVFFLNQLDEIESL